MDVAILFISASVGIGIGLIARKNGIKVFPNYREVDMGVIGKRYYAQRENKFQDKLDEDGRNNVLYGNRHHNHPKTK